MTEPIIDVFVSHAYNQVEIATDLKQKLQSDTFRVFLAHDDIDGGEEWMKMLYEKVQECDVFVVLLSDEYHKANYTDQETGIAYAMNKPMIPIAIDDTAPYGFMSKYQATKSITPFSGEKISEIANLIYAHTSQGQEIINGLVQQFSNATSFANANVVAKLLFSFKKFTNFVTEKVFHQLLEKTLIVLTTEFLVGKRPEKNKNSKVKISLFGSDFLIKTNQKHVGFSSGRVQNKVHSSLKQKLSKLTQENISFLMP